MRIRWYCLIKTKILGLKLTDLDTQSNWSIASIFGCVFCPSTISLQSFSWIRPPPGSFKINSDASLEDVGGGIGGAIRDSNGFLVSMFSINVDREDILALETLGVLTSLQQALQMGYGIIWLEVESKSTADIINGLSTIPWQSFRRIKEIQLLLSRFQRWSITHIWREGNCVADFLSKRKCPCKGVNISPFLSPPALLQLLDSDRAGTEYYRK
ncbi:uncharacterized protein LOC143861427 [Tasmannia lanceolata]|uniref:uncharacterized protein LOC143861427 n=1 Tax=Tasmannia lanceolata TaxID=3420 RepID=UPI004063C198